MCRCDRRLHRATVYMANSVAGGVSVCRVVTSVQRCRAQLDAAYEFLAALPADAAVDGKAFASACGVGVEIARSEIEAAIAAEIEKNKAALLEERYTFITGLLLVRALPRDLCLSSCVASPPSWSVKRRHRLP